jgi:four helix bundle protein
LDGLANDSEESFPGRDVVTYRSLEIWRLARDLSIEIHRLALEELPRFEMFEEGQQIRRSIKSVRSNIVEGYGRRRYRQDFLRFLTYALASAIETTDHLECLRETGSLRNQSAYESVHGRLDELGRKLNKFIQSVENEHCSVRVEEPEYGSDLPIDRETSIEHRAPSDQHRTSNIQHPTSNIKRPASDNQRPASSDQNPDS